jgi:hypothetical protein
VLLHRLNSSVFLEQILSKIKGTWSINPLVMFNRLLGAFIKGIQLSFVSPKRMLSTVLLFNELIVLNICCEKCLLLCRVAALSDFTESAAKFVFAILPRNVATVSWNLGSVIDLTHVLKLFITSNHYD